MVKERADIILLAYQKKFDNPNDTMILDNLEFLDHDQLPSMYELIIIDFSMPGTRGPAVAIEIGKIMASLKEKIN